MLNCQKKESHTTTLLISFDLFSVCDLMLVVVVSLLSCSSVLLFCFAFLSLLVLVLLSKWKTTEWWHLWRFFCGSVQVRLFYGLRKRT